MPSLTIILFCFLFPFFSDRPTTTSAVDFLFNSFPSSVSSDLILVDDAVLDSSVIRFTNDSVDRSIGRAFYRTQLPILTSNTTASSFSTSFVFSILPNISTSPGFGLAFVLTNSTDPPGALPGQYFGLFTNSSRQITYPLLSVEFDTGRNTEFNDPDGNHVGIDLNYITSSITHIAEYYLPSGEFQEINMRSGRNVRVWVEFDGGKMQISVTIAPAEITQKPERPLINYTDPEMRNFLSPTMFVGFSASKATWVEAQRVLAWSLSNTGSPAREIDNANLPIFLPPSSPSNSGLIAGVTTAALIVVVTIFAVTGVYYFHRFKKNKRKTKEEGEIEDWEMEYWPRRFSYEDLSTTTNGFSFDNLLGTGGFGKVYKGNLLGKEDKIAVKCVSHDSKQGIREFMAEISSMGRLQHKNLIHMRGWCRRGNDLMLVYDFMPNGSLDRWIFSTNSSYLRWKERKTVLLDVAEGLLYLHEGWEKVVLHRDVKPSNILMDKEMRGRLGDFGLAKLYDRNKAATCTRVVGTLGYLAPELGRVAAPTERSDVYSFGVVVLVVCCGRRAIKIGSGVGEGGEEGEEDFVLVDWVRRLYEEGRVMDGIDRRLDGMKEEEEEEEMVLMVKLGLACCHPDPDQRPTMKEVVGLLADLSVKTGRGSRPVERFVSFRSGSVL